MPDKLTDKEIVKALEIHLRISNAPCGKCAYYKYGQGLCIDKLNIDALNLINRLQAEIDRLNEEIELLHSDYTYKFVKSKAKAEAYKECIGKVSNIITEIYNKHIFGSNDLEAEEKDAIINFSDDVTYKVDNLLKELVGEDNAV